MTILATRGRALPYPTQHFTYDANGRMVEMDVDSDGDGNRDAVTTYAYDADGLRVRETHGSETRNN